MPGLPNVAEIIAVVKRNKRAVMLAIVCVLLLAVITYFIANYKEISNSLKMLTKADEQKLAAYPAPTRLKMRALLNGINDLGFDYIITSAVRTNGNDPHTRKHAIDLNITDRKTGKQFKMSTPKEEWLATGVPEMAIKLGFRWGGNFHTPYLYNGEMRPGYDPVHFDTE